MMLFCCDEKAIDEIKSFKRLILLSFSKMLKTLYPEKGFCVLKTNNTKFTIYTDDDGYYINIKKIEIVCYYHEKVNMEYIKELYILFNYLDNKIKELKNFLNENDEVVRIMKELDV